MKEIKDYLHLYLGCTCFYESKKGLAISKIDGNMISSPIHYPNIRLSLRPLSDMTEDEEKILMGNGLLQYTDKLNPNMSMNDYWKSSLMTMGKNVQYLLSKHFDIFGLIELGLAIDKTATTQKATL